MSSTYKQLTTEFGDVDKADSARPFISFLDSATAILRNTKELAFEMLGLETGHRVLDVGCGPGDDARRLAELVGSSGYVCGVDSSRSMIDEARKRSSGQTLPVQFTAAEVERLPMRDASFEVSRADRVLQHVKTPLKALSEMTRVVRSGGRVMVMDADHGMTAVNSTDRETTRIIMERFQRNLRNPWIGRQLPGLFRACELKDVAVQVMPHLFKDFAVASALVDFDGLARQTVEEELITESAASAWLNDLARRQEAGSFLFVMTGFLIVGRKE